ncbi:hypothetical protein EUV02_04075 [Polymorphobacter arshaanensis]|uniref:Uncharacterized protein n=1 Tax=Glacieibacterium arshaanense TaxID=2511025 RepID=A0A4Y9ERD2_9SPHN|nr:hypothetical protein [Polymorphobacter arshaanensis]TFU06196.1 hypothetical protein EUV02_04075 [Polymorphobacter arshaanensis]
MKPTRENFRQFFEQFDATHVFTLKPNHPGRPRGLRPMRIEPKTGEVSPVTQIVPGKYLMAPTIGIVRLSSLFMRLMVYFNRRVLGSHYHRPSRIDDRITAVAVVEGLPDAGHLHGMFKVPQKYWTRVTDAFPASSDDARPDPWSRISPGGTYEVNLLRDASEWADYITKESWRPDFSEKILFYPQLV